MSHGTTQPSSWVTRFAGLIRPQGMVLDLACGGGRHSTFFLNRQHPVTAIDRDLSALADAPDLTRIQTDLEDGSPWPCSGQRFAAVISTHYLWRPLFPTLIASLEPDGILIVETFALGNEAYGRPRNPDFLLKRGELLSLTQGLTVIAYEDGIMDKSRVVQRICALNGPGPAIVL